MLWLAGLFFWGLRKIASKFKLKKLWFVPFGFFALMIAALAYAPLPFGWGTIANLLASLTGWVLRWPATLLGVKAEIIGGVLLVMALAFGAVDLLKDRRPDAWAKGAVYAAPVLALVASGPFAADVVQVVQTLGGVGPTVISSLTS